MASSIDFTSVKHLQAHINGVLDFYTPHCQASVGFHHFFNDDGSVVAEAKQRHLVSETRFVWQFSLAFLRSSEARYQGLAKHGWKSLITKFKDPEHGHFRWTFQGSHLESGNALMYGHAFGLMAAVAASEAGVDVGTAVDDIWELVESKFYDPEQHAYADEMDADLQEVLPYRGQNANMHACEACIFAFKMKGTTLYLQRAVDLLETFVFRLCTEHGIWEHYKSDWSVDWDYNKDDRTNIFKPWGYQTGHQFEWAKMLVQVHEWQPDDRYLPMAERLFSLGWDNGWDAVNGGVMYAYDLQGQPCDTDKYFWTQSEGFATAALLYKATGKPIYLERYNQIWQYAWVHLAGEEHVAWYRLVDRANQRTESIRSSAGKVDYHTLSSCWEALDVFTRLDNNHNSLAGNL
eukprot:m.185045 g.185045  ORF g.185045 m.185045 type:complete len:405 (-) comp16911_c0_seq28:1438-2652(-)